MRSQIQLAVAFGATVKDLTLTFRSARRVVDSNDDVVVPKGTRCRKLDGGADPWVVDDYSFIKDKQSMLYSDITTSGLRVPEYMIIASSLAELNLDPEYHANFLAAVKTLGQLTHSADNTGVVYARNREALMATALNELAMAYGITLELPLQCDSNGEYSIVCKKVHYRAGSIMSYGAPFAALLNGYQPRTGITPGAVMLPEATWCSMNHFQVEKMLKEFAATFPAALLSHTETQRG